MQNENNNKQNNKNINKHKNKYIPKADVEMMREDRYEESMYKR